MKALRLKLFQETACYKKPFAFKVAETYPLPPYSTVKGMLHAVLNANELIPMRLCIQGSYDTIISDYQTHYFFKKNNTNEFALTVDGLAAVRKFTDITTMPIYMHLLYHVQLVIHVLADEKILKDIKESLIHTSSTLSLGRWEDLVRVDEIKMVELTEAFENVILPYDAYVPKEFIGYKAPHIPYRLNWTYRIVQGVRVWDKIEVGLMEAGQTLEADHEELYIDESGIPVFFHESSQQG